MGERVEIEVTQGREHVWSLCTKLSGLGGPSEWHNLGLFSSKHKAELAREVYRKRFRTENGEEWPYHMRVDRHELDNPLGDPAEWHMWDTSLHERVL